jgi:hypothetical protein
METLTIKRKKWLHGEGTSDSGLLRESDGKMCCLGFLARQRGARNKYILGVRTPCELTSRGHQQLKNLVVDAYDEKHTKIGDKLMERNDEEYMTDAKREKLLTTLFKRIKVRVKFVGSY